MPIDDFSFMNCQARLSLLSRCFQRTKHLLRPFRAERNGTITNHLHLLDRGSYPDVILIPGARVVGEAIQWTRHFGPSDALCQTPIYARQREEYHCCELPRRKRPGFKHLSVRRSSPTIASFNSASSPLSNHFLLCSCCRFAQLDNGVCSTPHSSFFNISTGACVLRSRS